MNSRNNINFSSKWSDLVDSTSIRSLMIFKDHLTNCLLLILIYGIFNISEPLFVLGISFLELSLDLVDSLFSCLLIICEYSCFHLLRSNNCLHIFKHSFRNSTALILELRLSNFCYDLVNKCDNCLIDLMALEDSFKHLVFRNDICSCFDHDNLLTCRSNCKLKIRYSVLLLCRVNYKLAVDKAHLCCCTWSVKRDI